MINLLDLNRFAVGERDFDLVSFDCGRQTINREKTGNWKLV